MPVPFLTTSIDAPVRTVAGALRDVDAVAVVLRRDGFAVDSRTRLVSAGDEVEIGEGVGLLRVSAAGSDGLVCVLAGPPRSELAVRLTAVPAGTQLIWTIPDGQAGLHRLLQAWSDELGRRAAALLVAPVIVATALLRGASVLAAQRIRPPALAGRWELPGGRVEAGESEPAAVVRECREELGTVVVPGVRLGTDLPIDAGVLRVHTARLAPDAREPRALEHSGLRWVGADEVAAVDWVDADRAVVTELVDLLVSREVPRPT